MVGRHTRGSGGSLVVFDFKAKTYYAAVGLANAKDYELPVNSDTDYVVNYPGIKEI